MSNKNPGAQESCAADAQKETDIALAAGADDGSGATSAHTDFATHEFSKGDKEGEEANSIRWSKSEDTEPAAQTAGDPYEDAWGPEGGGGDDANADENMNASWGEARTETDAQAQKLPKERPYVNPDRVKTGGVQREKLSPEELTERIQRIRLNNEKIKERRAAVQADEQAFKELQARHRAKETATRNVQASVDASRAANAKRKMDKVKGREWDSSKKAVGAGYKEPPQGQAELNVPESAMANENGANGEWSEAVRDERAWVSGEQSFERGRGRGRGGSRGRGGRGGGRGGRGRERGRGAASGSDSLTWDSSRDETGA